MNKKLKRLTTLSVLVATAMILSFVESQIPPIIPVPGVKLGLANIATLFALYKLGAPDALAVAVIRVSLSALLFGSVSSFAYAIAGALLSLGVMLLLKQLRLFATFTVSIAGAVMHNVAQIGVAMVILQTEVVIYYLPALLISGIVTGAVIGAVGALLLKKLEKTELG